MKFKKVFTLVCSLFMSVALLVGCNLVTVNNAKYYNQVVITVGDDVKYTKKDLIDAFYNYTYQYVTAGNMDTEKAVKQAATTLVERGLLVDAIKSQYFGTDKPLQLTDADRDQIRKSAFDSMQSQIDELEKTIREERDITIEENTSEAEETTESLRDAYKPYTPSVILDGNVAKYNTLKDSNEGGDNLLQVPAHFEQKITDADVSREAMTRYISTLQNTAKMQGKSTDEKQVVLDEENRLIKLYTDAKYLEKFQEYYAKSDKFDELDQLKDPYTVLQYYTTEYGRQKELYDGNSAKYYADMKSDSSKVIYHPAELGDKYMHVSHILIQFSDEQKSEIAKLDKRKATTNMSDETYNTELHKIADRTVVTYEEDGKQYTANVFTVYNRVRNYVDQSNDPVTRAQLFNDMIYKYNDDPGIMNKEFDYVVDLDDDIYGKDSSGKYQNIMVRSFTEAARALYDTNDTLNHGAGSMSELVLSEHGYHIILNTGAVRSLTNDIDSLDYQALLNAHTQLNGYKDLFNYYYDLINVDNYEKRCDQIVEQAKQNVKIVYYENRYKDLWK